MYLIISIIFLLNTVMCRTKDIDNNFDIKLNNKCWNNRETQNDLSLCYNDAFSFWNETLKDVAIDVNVKTCCSRYQYFDCVKDMVRIHCNSSDVRVIEEYIDLVNKNISCYKSENNENWCEFPTWSFIISLGLIIIFQASICFIFLFFCFRKK